MQKIAIFGGTFNPVHWGHLLIAEAAFDQLALDQVIWVPSYHPPHKSPDLLAFEHRFEMVRLAIVGQSAFSISDVEAYSSGKSYAIATLEALKILYPSTKWYWIIGLDAFCTLSAWQASRRIAECCTWLIAPRKGARGNGGRESNESELLAAVQKNTAQIPGVKLDWHELQMPEIGVSSSLVRQCCREGRSIRYLVPETVRDYILTRQLYTNSQH
jgi:nicotinate-nucleotide adenylyltransferase